MCSQQTSNRHHHPNPWCPQRPGHLPAPPAKTVSCPGASHRWNATWIFGQGTGDKQKQVFGWRIPRSFQGRFFIIGNHDRHVMHEPMFRSSKADSKEKGPKKMCAFWSVSASVVSYPSELPDEQDYPGLSNFKFTTFTGLAFMPGCIKIETCQDECAQNM